MLKFHKTMSLPYLMYGSEIGLLEKQMKDDWKQQRWGFDGM
jgi:hypothetical protein